MRILALIAVIFSLKLAKPALVPVALAVVLTLVLAPLVEFMQRRGRVPLPIGAAVALLAFFFAIALAVVLLLPSARDLLSGTLDGVEALGNLLARLRAAIPWLAPPLDAQAQGDQLREKLALESLNMTGSMFAESVSVTLTIVATIILTFLLLISERWIVVQSMLLLPQRRQRVRLLGALRESQREVAYFLVTMGMINIAMGAVTALLMAMIGLPNAVFWGVLVSVLNFIPYFGPMLLMGLFLLAGVSTFDGLGMMFAPLLIFVLVNMLESDVFSPWILGRRLRLNPLAIFLTVLLLGWLWGMVGAFLTLPVLIVARSIARRQRRKLFFIFIARAGEAPCSMRSLIESGEKHSHTLLDHYRSQARANGRR